MKSADAPKDRGRLYKARRQIRYTFLIIQKAGLGIFLHQLRRQFYSRTIFLGLEKLLGEGASSPPSSDKYRLALASPADIDEFFEKMEHETKELRYELLARKWFYECGFHNCYVVRTTDTNELCHVRWMVTSQDNEVIDASFQNRLPRLKKDEVLMENIFTFKEYRAKGITTSIGLQMAEIARKQGFRRIMAYVAEDNIPSLRACKTQGFQVFEKILERHVLFRATRKTIEEISPSVPILIA